MVGNNAKITLEQFKLKDKQDKELHKIALQEIVELLSLPRCHRELSPMIFQI